MTKDGGISLGKKTQSEYKAVLGDTAVELMSEFITEVQKIKVATAMGPSGIPLPTHVAALKAIKDKLNTMLSTKVTLIK